MEPLFWLNIALSVAGAVLFGLVGRVIARRPVSPPTELARNAFVLWWISLAVVSVAGALMPIVAAYGVRDLPFYLTVTFGMLLLICVAFWGLLFYLLFLYLNSRTFAWTLAAAYLALFLWLVYIILARQPVGLMEVASGVEIQFVHPPNAMGIWAALAFIVPVIAAAIGYLSLAFKVPDRILKQRILIVGFSLLVWFATSLPGTANSELAQDYTWRLVRRFVGLSAAAAIFYAYAALKPNEAVASRP